VPRPPPPRAAPPPARPPLLPRLKKWSTTGTLASVLGPRTRKRPIRNPALCPPSVTEAGRSPRFVARSGLLLRRAQEASWWARHRALSFEVLLPFLFSAGSAEAKKRVFFTWLGLLMPERRRICLYLLGNSLTARGAPPGILWISKSQYAAYAPRAATGLARCTIHCHASGAWRSCPLVRCSLSGEIMHHVRCATYTYTSEQQCLLLLPLLTLLGGTYPDSQNHEPKTTYPGSRK
jgi:hypothetical protein